MTMNAYALAFEQARNDLSWIDRELERLNTQQKQLLELLNCLQHFVIPNGHASIPEHVAENEEKAAVADSPVSQATETLAASPEAGEQTGEPLEEVKLQ